MPVISHGDEVKDTALHPGLCACGTVIQSLHSENFPGKKVNRPNRKKPGRPNTPKRQ